MTRINCVPVSELTDKHLVAEYRELPRLRHAKHANGVPDTYRMGEGHCRFFYNKGRYLMRRHAQLIDEMKRRGCTVNLPTLKLDWPADRMKDWRPGKADRYINRQRIKERMSKNEP